MIDPTAIGDYLDRALRTRVSIEESDAEETFPLSIRTGYHFFRLRIGSGQNVLMIDAGRARRSPTRIAREVARVSKRQKQRAIYATDRLTRYQRDRLIELGTPFLVPGRHLYLPNQVVELQERFSAEPATALPDRMTPITQVTTLYWIYNGFPMEARTPTELARALGYSKMSASRSLDELEGFGVITTKRVGRNRRINHPGTGREIWQRALPFLASPVAGRVWIRPDEPIDSIAPSAGISALAATTDIAAPKVPVRSLHRTEARSTARRFDTSNAPREDPGWCELELWSYDPMTFAHNGRVDPLSLFLSLRTDPDERIEAALEQLLREVAW